MEELVYETRLDESRELCRSTTFAVFAIVRSSTMVLVMV